MNINHLNVYINNKIIKDKDKLIQSIIDDIIKKLNKLSDGDWKSIVLEAKKLKINLPKTYRLAYNRYTWENILNISPYSGIKSVAFILSYDIINGLDINKYKKLLNLLSIKLK